MTRSAASPSDSCQVSNEAEPRPAKRLRTKLYDAESDSDAATLVRRHPLGVRPSGNALTSNSNLKAACGLFAKLPDELLLQFFETLNIPHLLKLGSTCKALHAFSRSEELWRSIFVESGRSSFSWRGTWRSTFLSQPSSNEPRVDCSNLFSDVLHRPFFCAHVPLAPFASNIPAQNSVARLSNLSPEDFSDWFDRPFILTDPVKQWPVYQHWSSMEVLLEKFSSVKFRAESVDWPLISYMEYMRDAHDESPLYLFDRSFVEKMQLAPNDYSPPACFGGDVFTVLGKQRPDHRWLIIGPERSGSTFHKDPNATSAWNAVIRGSKYWIMFPSSSSMPPPPGVYISHDQSEVTSPLSIAEWLLGFHAEARATPGCKEGICYEGEVLHVPSGWYHLVLNLEESIAITQNFIPRQRVGAVLQFLRDQKESISGFDEGVEDPYALFVENLRESNPQLLEDGFLALDKLTRGKRGKWEELTKRSTSDEHGEANHGFSFGFGGGEDDDDETP